MSSQFRILVILLFILQIIFCKKDKNSNKNIDKKLLSQLITIDKYKDSIFGLQLGSNNPIEDSFFIQNITLLNNEGLFFAIFDGHGGDHLSKYANLLLYPYFLEAFNVNIFIQDFNKRIVISLNQSFDRIENEFLKIAFYESIKKNYIYSHVGSCALAGIIINKKIFVSNIGDSKARLFFLNEKDNRNDNINKNLKYEVKKLSKTFNIRKNSEQTRMRKQFPKDKDIIKCYGHKICYIKGLLQPTKSLGDYSLKYLYFNIKDLTNIEQYDKYKKFFNGPYISSVPDIQVYDLKDNYKYLILGNNGLWEVIRSKDMAGLIYNFTDINVKNKKFFNNKRYNNLEKIGYGLIDASLINYSKATKHDGDYNFFLETPLGRERRYLHDDITIIVCDLTKY